MVLLGGDTALPGRHCPLRSGEVQLSTVEVGRPGMEAHGQGGNSAFPGMEGSFPGGEVRHFGEDATLAPAAGLLSSVNHPLIGESSCRAAIIASRTFSVLAMTEDLETMAFPIGLVHS